MSAQTIMSTTGKFDPSTLGWVKTEIDESLKQARQALESLVENPSDTTQLRFCITHLHQVVGTLEMVELGGAALLAKETEALAQAFLDEKLKPEGAALDSLTRGILMLPDYLGRLQFGQPDMPLRLLPVINQLREAQSLAPIAESELFEPDLSVRPPRKESEEPKPSEEEYIVLAQKLRPVFQSSLLKWLRDPTDTESLKAMTAVVEQLEQQAPLGMLEQLFWVATGLIEAVSENSLEVTGDVKKLFARMEQQIKKLIDGSEKSQFRSTSENLVKSILFHVGQIKSGGERVTQLIRAFNLHQLFAEAPDLADQEIEDLPTPETVQSVSAALKTEIESAQDLLSAYFDPDEQDVSSFDQLPGLLKKMSSTVEMLGIPVIQTLVNELAEICQAIKDKRIGDPESVSMPMARALLLLESSLSEISTPEGAWKKQVEESVETLHRLHSPESDDAPGVDGIEVSEVELTDTEFKQLLSAVSGEVRVNLTKIEEALEIFAGNANQTELLATVPQNLSQIEGALQILGQDKAAELASVTSDIIQQLHDGMLKSGNRVLDGLAVAIGTIGAFIDGLEAGRQSLESLIDAALNDLDDAVNNSAGAVVAQPENLIDVLQKNLNQWLESLDGVVLTELQRNLEEMSAQAEAADQHRVKKICEEMNNLLQIVSQDPAQLSDDIAEMLQASSKALVMFSGERIGGVPIPRMTLKDDVTETVIVRKEAFEEPEPTVEESDIGSESDAPAESEPVPVARTELAGTNSEDDDFDIEIMQIFVEDAKEVYENIKKDFADWQKDHDNWDALTELRRSFHTLKGSGRMVGASEIAELGWEIENLINRVRESKIPMSEPIFALVEQTKDVLPSLIAHLEGGPAPEADVAGLREKAKALASVKATAVEPKKPVAVDAQPKKAEKQKKPAVEPAPKIDATLLGIFTNEARGHLATIKQEVENNHGLAKPGTPSKNLLRSVHTLQGNARSLGIRFMAETCGEMEKMLLHMEAEGIAFTDAHLDLLSDIETSVSRLVDAMNNGGDVSVGLDEAFERILVQIGEEAAALPVSEEDDDSELEDAGRVKSEPSPMNVEEKKEVPQPAAKTAQREKKKAKKAIGKKTPAATKGKMPMIAKQDNVIDDELLEIFLEEAADILDTIESGLRAWRKDTSDRNALQNIKRALHTLKGGARMAGAMIMGDLSHATENVFRQIEENAVTPGDEIFDLLEEIQDTLVVMVDRLQSKQAAPDLTALQAKIASVFSGESTQAASDEAEPVAVDVETGGISEEDAAEAEDDADEDTVEEVAYADESEPSLQMSEAGFEQDDRRAESRLDSEASSDRRGQIKVRTGLLNELTNYAGEVSISRSRMEQQIYGFRENLGELHRNVIRFRDQIRELEIQSESQILYRAETDTVLNSEFDPLELDRFSNLQQLSRSLSESLHDLSTIQMSLDNFVGEAETVLVQQARINTDLQEGLMRTRMIDFSSQAARLRHILRQTARELGKRAELNITGSEVSVDKNVLERMIGPFEHMIRNAIDHGIESNDERKRAGKSPVGQVTIDTSQEGGEIVIRFSDDGAGLDVGNIRRKAVERELIPSDASLSDEEIMQFILLPGFSTAVKLTHFSGRGVGMDVVHNEVKQLGGSMSVETKQGKGATFIIRLPLTLSVNQALMVSVGDQLFAIPLSSVTNIIEVSRDKLEEISAGKKPLLNYDDHVYPFMNLGSRLLIPSLHRNGKKVPVLLAKAGEREVAIQVDGLSGTREVVVKSVGPQLSEVKGLAGATVFGDGSVVLILDVPGLWFTDEAMHLVRPVEQVPEPEEINKRPTVMVVDDSLTVRKITSRHLQKQGYDIMIAKDGIDAIEQLRDRVPDLMLIDIEMPRMDGYELTSRVRSTSYLKHIPIIMITSRAGAKHKKRAFSLGVNVYMSKPYQEDDLFNNIATLIKERQLH